jgi:hypothetical protein
MSFYSAFQTLITMFNECFWMIQTLIRLLTLERGKLNTS